MPSYANSIFPLGVFNFAHGAMATVSAYAFYTLHVINGVVWQLALAICVLGIGPAMGLALELVARVVDRATLELRIAATVGILLVVQAGATLYYGQTTTRIVPIFLPQGGFAAFGVQVQWSDVATFGVAVLATAALSAALRFTRVASRCARSSGMRHCWSWPGRVRCARDDRPGVSALVWRRCPGCCSRP